MKLESKRSFNTPVLVISIAILICSVSIVVLFEKHLWCTSIVKQDLNKNIHEQNETIVKLNGTIVNLNGAMLKQNEAILKLNVAVARLNVKIVEQISKITTQSKKIDKLENKVLVYSGKAKSCKHIKELVPSSVNGVYEIEVDGEKLEVRCEMNSASGGWTVFHRRYDGSVNFKRKWTSFEDGFGELNGEFWLGLKKLNKLTKNSVNDLRVEISSFDGETKYAKYTEFRIADATENYKISFNGGVHDGSMFRDSLSSSNGMEFSTFDKDNDASDGNCAASFGANWWRACGSNNINGKYGGNGDSGNEFMCWKGFWKKDKVDRSTSLKSMTLMFRQTD